MHVQIPHQFSQKNALERVKGALADSRKQIADHATIEEERWQGDTLYFDVKVQGHRISGTFAVMPTEFVLDAKLPLLWRMFEGKIEKAIAEQTKSLTK